jgi:hypothetical protein
VRLNAQLGVMWSNALSSFSFLLGPSRDLDAFELEHIRTETCARYNYDMMVWLHCTEAYDLRDWHKSDVRNWHGRDVTSTEIACNRGFP